MDLHCMADEWKSEKQHVMRRMDRFDQRFDKIDEIISKQGEQIDALRVEVLKIASGMTAFKGEFRYKTGAWAFLGTAIALIAGVIIYMIKTQLV